MSYASEIRRAGRDQRTAVKRGDELAADAARWRGEAAQANARADMIERLTTEEVPVEWLTGGPGMPEPQPAAVRVRDDDGFEL